MRVACLFIARLLVACLGSAALLAPAPVHAADRAGGSSPSDDGCGTGGYDYLNFLTDSLEVTLPDCGGPVRIGPNIVTLDDLIGETVIVMITMQHTWIGDIRLSLEHDADCDGVAETSAMLMCRAGSGDPSCSTGGARGCDDDLDGNYGFFDWSPRGVLGDPFASCAGGVVPPGCYRPVTALSVFAGQSTRGCWWLVAEDCACGDEFRVIRWGGGRIGGAMPTELTSWGAIKYRYR